MKNFTINYAKMYKDGSEQIKSSCINATTAQSAVEKIRKRWRTGDIQQEVVAVRQSDQDDYIEFC